jgi:predicted O-methyltransferase YrrM
VREVPISNIVEQGLATTKLSAAGEWYDNVTNKDAAVELRRVRHIVTHRVPLSVRRLPFRAADSVIGVIDSRRLRKGRPGVAAALDAIRDGAELRHVYERYVTEVSTRKWAVSWPTACVLVALCDALRPRRILDLGSGLSTYVVSDWARRCAEGVDVVSVDDSPEWRAKTRAFLEEHRLDARLIDIAALCDLPNEAFDLVFDDVGRSEDRARFFETIRRAVAPRAAVVLDDMNVRSYRKQIKARLRHAGWSLYSIRPYTIDAKGRFAMLAFAP